MIQVLIFLLLLVAGCDTSVEKSVTADYNSTEPRGLKTLALPVDSLTVGTVFRKGIGSSSYTLAGRYGDTSAFSVFLFNMSNINKDNVIDAYVEFDVDDKWEEGKLEFDIFDTRTDWADSVLINGPDFTDILGQPLSTVDATITEASEDSILSTISFQLGADIVKSWGDAGALLVQSSPNGEAMVSFLSDNTNYPPQLNLVKLYSDGDIDTTSVYASEGTFWLKQESATDLPLVSEGSGDGFTLNVNFDGLLPKYATINDCKLTVTIQELQVAATTMNVDVYRLEDQFEAIESAGLASEDKVIVNIYSDTYTFDIDLTDIMNDWHVGGQGNHGLLFQPANEGMTPSFSRMSFQDSVYITYSPFPKVE